MEAWTADPRTNRSGQPTYSNLVIATALTPISPGAPGRLAVAACCSDRMLAKLSDVKLLNSSRWHKKPMCSVLGTAARRITAHYRVLRLPTIPKEGILRIVLRRP